MKRGLIQRFVLTLLALAIPIGAIPVHTAAVEGIDLTTSPLPINLSMKPGASITTDIRVKNNSTSTQELKVGLMKFAAYGEEGKPALLDRQPGDDYFDWVSFNRPVLSAPPNVWQTVKMTINAPRDAAFGYYYAVVFTPSKGKPTGKGNILIGSSAVLVLLEVQSPNARKNLEIASFSSDHRVYEFLPSTFTLRFHNKGNVHVIPHGAIYIEKGGQQIGQLIFNGQQGNVLPGTYRNFKVSWDTGFPRYDVKTVGQKVEVDKNGVPIQHLKWDFTKASQFRVGRYTAHLVGLYDDGSKDVPLEARVSFWVIPWRIVGGLLLVVSLIGLGIWGLLRPMLRNMKKRNAKK